MRPPPPHSITVRRCLTCQYLTEDALSVCPHDGGLMETLTVPHKDHPSHLPEHWRCERCATFNVDRVGAGSRCARCGTARPGWRLTLRELARLGLAVAAALAAGGALALWLHP